MADGNVQRASLTLAGTTPLFGLWRRYPLPW